MQAKWILALVFSSFSMLLLVGCSPDKHEAQGYIEGRYTYMATPVSGVLKQISVVRGSKVKKGQTLATLEEQPESDLYDAQAENLNQSISARDAIIANLAFAKLTFERYKILVPKKAIQQSQLDNAKSIFDASLAQLAEANSNIASAQATLAQTKWTREQKVLISPVDAIVFDTYYRLGEYTEASKAILSLLAPRDIKAIFYVSGPELRHLSLGKTIFVRCDGCEKNHEGKISFISPSAEYTPPVIYSNQTNEKLIFRIEAEFADDIACLFHPGQPVNVSYQVANE